MNSSYSQIKDHISQFEKIVSIFADSVAPPLMYESGIRHRGFRYANPTPKHFCVIKVVRAVSGINAALVLAENGFNQEMCVMIRTIIDSLTQIDYVISGLHDGKLQDRQQKLVNSFFDDFRRNSTEDFGKVIVRQEQIHEEIEKFFKKKGVAVDFSIGEKLSTVYRVYSNYVHARYPEAMDLYGGHNGRFYLRGMKGTPKDQESFQIILTFTDSVALTLAKMINAFDMADTIRDEPTLSHWIKK